MTYQPQVESIVESLAVPTRRVILEKLRDGPLSVSQLARGLPVSRPAVSQHLKILKEAGLVRDRRVGTRRIYSVDPAGLAELRNYIERFWTAALAGLKATSEAESRRR